MVTNPRISVCQPSTNLAFGPGFQPHHDTGLDGVVHIIGGINPVSSVGFKPHEHTATEDRVLLHYLDGGI
ncbi:hypothetical protein GCM10025859_55170 [Alicyclobacillus fastidiosus]|nr:hypothetical protein GCM10025859_55170 [Alicyclobacillus fastidiosus]